MSACSVPTEDGTLLSRLSYEPQELKFGTSGRRGEVVHLSQLELYINVAAELEYLLSRDVAEGGIERGGVVCIAWDLRPSSTHFSPAQQGRGELAQAVVRAIEDAGMTPVNMGSIPTPALANFGLVNRQATIMVTGSHIPFDRNGYKTTTSAGELSKEDEEPIGLITREIRHRLYHEPFPSSLFDGNGMFKSGHADLPAEDDSARRAYTLRYQAFFPAGFLKGRRILVYEHSAVGRDVLVDLLESFGAEVVRCGRSDTFIPIDTEAIDDDLVSTLQRHVTDVSKEHGPVWAVVSMDGDSDRPLILGVDQASGKARFITGDLAGMIVAEYLGADAVVVPISCNDAIDRGNLAPVLRPRTRIGSPYVIAGMNKALAEGKKAVCGWEANGGFLTASTIYRDGKMLRPLPTRDAMLPILAVLAAAEESGVTLTELFARLPQRFNRATLIREFPREISSRIVAAFTAAPEPSAIARLTPIFSAERSFAAIARIDRTDGLRLLFRNGDVVHLRPSGNADEFRIYATADSSERAASIAHILARHPGGMIQELQVAASSGGF